MKKALFIITLISISLATTTAQETEQKNKFLQWATANNSAYADSTETSVVVKQPENLKISPTLTSGDYLIKASNNVGVGAVFGILTGVTGIILAKTNEDIAKNNAKTNVSAQDIEKKAKALKSEKNVLAALTVGFGVTSFSFICIAMPINLHKAGKAYNQEHKK